MCTVPRWQCALVSGFYLLGEGGGFVVGCGNTGGSRAAGGRGGKDAGVPDKGPGYIRTERRTTLLLVRSDMVSQAPGGSQ